MKTYIDIVSEDKCLLNLELSPYGLIKISEADEDELGLLLSVEFFPCKPNNDNSDIIVQQGFLSTIHHIRLNGIDDMQTVMDDLKQTLEERMIEFNNQGMSAEAVKSRIMQILHWKRRITAPTNNIEQ